MHRSTMTPAVTARNGARERAAAAGTVLRAGVFRSTRGGARGDGAARLAAAGRRAAGFTGGAACWGRAGGAPERSSRETFRIASALHPLQYRFPSNVTAWPVSRSASGIGLPQESQGTMRTDIGEIQFNSIGIFTLRSYQRPQHSVKPLFPGKKLTSPLVG